MQDHRYLVCVDGMDNHNKFYEATLNDDNSIDVTYGRVGSSATQHHYRPGEKNFNTLIASKERKGYRDITDQKEVGNKDLANDKEAFKKMEDAAAEDFLKHFLEVCRIRVAKNYRNAGSATDKQIDQAKTYISQLEYQASQIEKNVSTFVLSYAMREANDTLQKLFTILPRNMGSVQNFMFSQKDNGLDRDGFLQKLDKIIDRETDLIDSLAVVKSMDTKKVKKNNKTIAEDLGVSIKRASYKDEDIVKELMDRSKVDNRSSDRRECMHRMYAITNEKTKAAFDKCRHDLGIDDAHTKLLFHGSGQENWYTIMGTGLKLKPNAIITGKGLGNGIYFADDINKALNYTRGTDVRYIGVYEVATGKEYQTDRYNTGYALHNIKGNDCVFLDGKKLGGHHLNEYCVFREEQTNLRFIIECEKERQKDVRFSMHLSVPFKDQKESDGVYTATAEISDYAKKELKKVITGRIGKITCKYVPDNAEFSLYNGDEKINLSMDETERLFRDYKKSFYESEYEFEQMMTKEAQERMMQQKEEEMER